ncbi:hypothetical protein [Nonomuraea sp. NPDC049480]|uniref:hypothetical protein n=1 Tax=Nonomuraea sp. NPDC049480 TaxID=3364353 RepID=UPI00378EFBFA
MDTRAEEGMRPASFMAGRFLPRPEHHYQDRHEAGMPTRDRGVGTRSSQLGAHDSAPLTKPATTITTEVRDAQTEDPVAWACVMALTLQNARDRQCAAYSGQDGKVSIRVPANTYTLLVTPHYSDTTHGIQWVGHDGGTGSQYLARKITTSPGRATAIPPIELDGWGSISGVIRDAATGSPVTACAEFLPLTYGGGCTNAEGRFALNHLGPYRWPVHFRGINTASGYAWQWSGDVPNRMIAKSYKVAAGETATISDVKLNPAGGVLTGNILDLNGQPYPGGRGITVEAVNAITGDLAAPPAAGLTYKVQGLASQFVKLRTSFWATNQTIDLWYPATASFADARPVRVLGGQIRELDLKVGSESHPRDK